MPKLNIFKMKGLANWYISCFFGTMPISGQRGIYLQKLRAVVRYRLRNQSKKST
jgi:hypothetical protein